MRDFALFMIFQLGLCLALAGLYREVSSPVAVCGLTIAALAWYIAASDNKSGRTSPESDTK